MPNENLDTNNTQNDETILENDSTNLQNPTDNSADESIDSSEKLEASNQKRKSHPFESFSNLSKKPQANFTNGSKPSQQKSASTSSSKKSKQVQKSIKLNPKTYETISLIQNSPQYSNHNKNEIMALALSKLLENIDPNSENLLPSFDDQDLKSNKDCQIKVSLRLTPDEIEKLQNFGKEIGFTSYSKIIRTILVSFINKHNPIDQNSITEVRKTNVSLSKLNTNLNSIAHYFNYCLRYPNATNPKIIEASIADLNTVIPALKDFITESIKYIRLILNATENKINNG